MTKIFLSGAGGSTNWLPLILPLLILLTVIYGFDYAYKLMRRRKLLKANALIEKLTTPGEATAENDQADA